MGLNFLNTSPAELASQQLKSILDHGTPEQIEAVLMTLRIVAMIKPGEHGRQIERAIDALRNAMS